MSKIYTMYWKKRRENTAHVRPLDGDFRKVFPTGYEFNPVTNSLKIDDMPRLHKRWGYQGVPVDLTQVPTKAYYQGKMDEFVDIFRSHNWFLVSEKLRQAIESVEPNKHQFSPIEIVTKKNGTHIADYFWFNPCARVDGMDREHTTHPLIDVGVWDQKPDGKYVASLAQIGKNHIWMDPLTYGDTPFISQQMKDAFEAAGVEGLGYGEFEAV